ncbi:MAG: DUF177 domain-containing protein [Bacteroidales bacterium]|jgi:uncharacterized metal-binding protein YceD (DUF177 family)|nr:DUF177 domain-containing protein [Bacteroidales bacterium]
MKKNRYSIKFTGLALGEHHFDFHIDTSLLEQNNYHDIEDCNVDVAVILLKEERLLTLKLNFSGNITVLCDRCLSPIALPVDCQENIIVKITHQNNFDNDFWEIGENEHQLDLSNVFYETVALQRPLSVMHDIKNCNPKVIALLQKNEIEEEKPQQEEGWKEKLKNFL